MIKLLSVLLIFGMGTTVGILVLIFGWGLSPQSWGWIIGGAVFQFSLMIMATIIGEKK